MRKQRGARSRLWGLGHVSATGDSPGGPGPAEPPRIPAHGHCQEEDDGHSAPLVPGDSSRSTVGGSGRCQINTR